MRPDTVQTRELGAVRVWASGRPGGQPVAKLPLSFFQEVARTSVEPAESLSEAVICTGVMGSLYWTVCDPGVAVSVGGSFTGVTVIETVAGALSTVPSLTVKVKLSLPL